MAGIYDTIQLGNLILPNRIIKSATYEGLTPNGQVTPGLIEFHRKVAAGGTALTTVAYCGVHADGRTFPDQMVMDEATLPGLKQLCSTVHAAGGKISGQMAHCGFFSTTAPTRSKRPLGPSFTLNEYGLFNGLPFGGAMTRENMEQTCSDYAAAAKIMVQAGFDALEIHMGHGYLLSQFLSPATNKRKDAYGGSLDNRLRFPLEVLQAVRNAVGEGYPIIVKMNLRDGFSGGMELEESIQVAQALEQQGADALELSGGFTSKTPMYLFRGLSPLKEMIRLEKNPYTKIALRFFGKSVVKEIPYHELYFLEDALNVRAAVKLPLIYLGGASSRQSIEQALEAGFDMVALGRTLIYDTEMVNRMKTDSHYVSGCNHCNLCVPSMNSPEGVQCVWKLNHPQP